MSGRLDGKVALVTGVSAGIGGAVARRFAAEGASVSCTGNEAAAIEEVVADIESDGGRASASMLDVTNPADWAGAFDCGPPNILVNNAGVLLLADIADTSLEQFRRVHAVNVEGVFLGMKFAIEAMREAGCGGSIINISSVCANLPCADHVAYGSSKAAVSGMTRHAAHDCVADAIRVNAICPGVVRTPMLINTPENLAEVEGRQPLGIIEPEEIAEAAVFLASDESRHVTGTELLIDGGISV